MLSVKLWIFSYPLVVTYVLGAQKNRLIETALLSTHNTCFGWEIRKLSFLVLRTLNYRPGYTTDLFILNILYRIPIVTYLATSEDPDEMPHNFIYLILAYLD